MTKIETLSISLGIIKYHYDQEQEKNDQSPVTYDDAFNSWHCKASQQSNVPTKFLKQNSDCFAEYFDENINHCISKSIFQSDLKSADVSPVYKKKLKKSKGNCRPVSILSNISKTYERYISDQIQLFFDSCPNINTSFIFGVPQG